MINFETVIWIDNFDPITRKISYTSQRILNQRVDYKKDFPEIIETYTPTKGDRLWFYPGCDIPRFKVKQFCQKYDVAVVKYTEKSNIRFISPRVIDELIIDSYTYQLPKEYFLNWLSTVMCNDYIQLEQDIIKSSGSIVCMNYSVKDSFCEQKNFSRKLLFSGQQGSYYDHICYIKDEDCYKQIVNISNDKGLYHQDGMLSLLNTGTIMNEDMYRETAKLFESSDNTNTVLAMEAMANCDFQKSAVYLLLLIRENSTKIYNSSNRNHVNFKSLLRYFNITAYTLTRLSVDDLLNSLRAQKLLSLTNLNMLMPLIMETVKEKGDMQYIKVKDVELSNEALTSIAENILEPLEIPTPEPTQDLQPDLSTIPATLDTAPGAFK